jgi:hypothetical protein
VGQADQGLQDAQEQEDGQAYYPEEEEVRPKEAFSFAVYFTQQLCRFARAEPKVRQFFMEAAERGDGVSFDEHGNMQSFVANATTTYYNQTDAGSRASAPVAAFN